MERYLEFEQKLEQVHKPGRVNPAAVFPEDWVRIAEDWTIRISEKAGEVLEYAAKDLQDYFQVSMGLALPLERGEGSEAKTIFLSVDPALSERSFRIAVGEGIAISGAEERYTAQGSYALEDICNLNEAPVLEPGEHTRKMRFSFRCVNSGYHDDRYPDGYLARIAHAGMTAIDASQGSLLTDPKAAEQMNDLVRRAGRYGLDVYCYPHFVNTVHPEEEGAFAHYDGLYGKILELCPGIKGFILVGESCEFPSRDPRTTGKSWQDSLQEEKSSPGWFPCSDYPQFVGLLRDVIRSHSSEAEIVFWTYNWGYEEPALREELLRKVPEGVTMMATFEMFEPVEVAPEVREVTTDYTLWQIGPGRYFSTESGVARERGLRMYSMTNTGGNTWDIGGVPYLPAPQRWIRRWQAVTNAQDTMKLDGMRETHTYGFWPSFLPEMAKYAYMLPETDLNALLEKIICRDFGRENLAAMLQVFALFSEGMSHCVSTNEDQYGPARVGPSYPLFFKRWEWIPNCPVTGRTVNYEGFPLYVFNLDRQERLLYETGEYEQMLACFTQGCDLLAQVLDTLEGRKKADAVHILQVAQYIRNNARTIWHVKRWHRLKGLLGVYVDAAAPWVGGRKNMEDAKKAEKPLVPVPDKRPVVEELIAIARDEIENAKDTIALVEANSRLGFEKEYGYSCSRMQLEWKIQNAERTIAEELLPLLEE